MVAIVLAALPYNSSGEPQIMRKMEVAFYIDIVKTVEEYIDEGD